MRIGECNVWALEQRDKEISEWNYSPLRFCILKLRRNVLNLCEKTTSSIEVRIQRGLLSLEDEASMAKHIETQKAAVGNLFNVQPCACARWLGLNEEQLLIRMPMLSIKNWMKSHVQSAWNIRTMLFSSCAARMRRVADLTSVIQVTGIQIA
ncbi:hypothetical protein V6N13_112682 [Hibiscus sabdariffa]